MSIAQICRNHEAEAEATTEAEVDSSVNEQQKQEDIVKLIAVSMNNRSKKIS